MMHHKLQINKEYIYQPNRTYFRSYNIPKGARVKTLAVEAIGTGEYYVVKTVEKPVKFGIVLGTQLKEHEED